MNILALDLATVTGWAIVTPAGIRSGSTAFRNKKRDHAGQRWIDFRAWLSHVVGDAEIGAIYVEDLVLFKGHGTPPLILYASMFCVVEAWACLRRVPVHRVHNATVKKHWTGSGRASKDDMVAEAKQRGFKPRDDNEADALAILDYAVIAEGFQVSTAIERAPVPREAGWVSPFEQQLFGEPKATADLSA